VFRQDDYLNAKALVLNDGGRIWQRLILKSSVNLASQRVLYRVRELLDKMTSATVLVVGCGCQRKWLDERLGSGGSLQTVYTDINANADVDLFCDGHDLPFVDGVFDAVVTTAVLEHVEDNPAAMDGASCTYLFGCKIEGRIPDADIIARYVAAKHLRHT